MRQGRLISAPALTSFCSIADPLMPLSRASTAPLQYPAPSAFPIPNGCCVRRRQACPEAAPVASPFSITPGFPLHAHQAKPRTAAAPLTPGARLPVASPPRLPVVRATAAPAVDPGSEPTRLVLWPLRQPCHQRPPPPTLSGRRRFDLHRWYCRHRPWARQRRRHWPCCTRGLMTLGRNRFDH